MTMDTNTTITKIYLRRYGRLGNNIVQIINTLILSEVLNITTIYVPRGFCMIKHPAVIKEKGIKVIPKNVIPKGVAVLCASMFMYRYYKTDPYEWTRLFAGEIVKSPPQVNVGEDELYIHIRSGDVYLTEPSSYYAQPPLCFYEGIIKKWGFRNIFILSQDTKNPVINPLREKYNAKLMTIDLPETIGYILSARNLVVSFGTFVPSLLRLIPDDPSKRIFRYGNRFWYCTDIWKKMIYLEPSKEYVDKLLSENWKNTKKQREMMMNETCGNDWKISMYTTYKEWEDNDKQHDRTNQ